MKNQRPINIHSLRDPITTVPSVEKPFRRIRKTEKAEWRKLSHERRCDDCGSRLAQVIAFKQIPIGFCKNCQEEKEL